MGRGRGGHLMGRQTDEEDVENAERKGRNKGRSTENKYCLLELSAFSTEGFISSMK